MVTMIKTSSDLSVSGEKTEVIPFYWLIIIIIFFGFN